MRRPIAAALCLGLLSASHGAAAAITCAEPLGDHVVAKTFTCPLGGESFPGLVLGTHSTFGAHYDLEPVSYMPFPRPLPVCPNGFVIYKESFSEAELESLAEIIDTPAYRSAMETHTTYYLFALLSDAMGDLDGELWAIYLQATWQANHCAAHLYAEYAATARAAIEAKLGEAGIADGFRVTLQFLAANLYRRVGDFAAARRALMAVTLSEDVVPDAERRTTYQAMHDELLGFIDREDVEQQLILAGD
jgi:hypothetical protein